MFPAMFCTMVYYTRHSVMRTRGVRFSKVLAGMKVFGNVGDTTSSAFAPRFASVQVPAVLYAGSALGAQRHWGSIPWDLQDFDLCVFTWNETIAREALSRANRTFAAGGPRAWASTSRTRRTSTKDFRRTTTRNRKERRPKYFLEAKIALFGYHVSVVLAPVDADETAGKEYGRGGLRRGPPPPGPPSSVTQTMEVQGVVSSPDHNTTSENGTEEGALRPPNRGAWIDVWLYGFVHFPKEMEIEHQNQPRPGSLPAWKGPKKKIPTPPALLPIPAETSHPDELFDPLFEPRQAVRTGGPPPGDHGGRSSDLKVMCVGSCPTSGCRLEAPLAATRRKDGGFQLNVLGNDTSKKAGAKLPHSGCAVWFGSHRRENLKFDLKKLFPLKLRPYGPWLLPVFHDARYYLDTVYGHRWNAYCAYSGALLTKEVRAALPFQDKRDAWKWYYDRAVMPCAALWGGCNFAFDWRAPSEGGGERVELVENGEDRRVRTIWETIVAQKSEGTAAGTLALVPPPPTTLLEAGGGLIEMKNRSSRGEGGSYSALFRGGKVLAVFREGRGVEVRVSEKELRAGVLWGNGTTACV